MPNLELAKRRALLAERRRALDAKKGQTDELNKALVSRYETIKELLASPGWEAMQEDLLDTYEVALGRFLSDDPLSEVEMNNIRAQLIAVDRLLLLDQNVTKKLESLRKPDRPVSVDGQE